MSGRRDREGESNSCVTGGPGYYRDESLQTVTRQGPREKEDKVYKRGKYGNRG